jgi:hypothetical protein
VSGDGGRRAVGPNTQDHALLSYRLVKIAHFQTYQQLSPHDEKAADLRPPLASTRTSRSGRGERMVTGMVTNSTGLGRSRGDQATPPEPKSQTNQHRPRQRGTEQNEVWRISKPPPSATRPPLQLLSVNNLAAMSGEQKWSLATRSFAQGCIDRRRLAVVGMTQA